MKLIWVIIFIVFGCWIWNRYGNGITTIYQSSSKVVTTSSNTIEKTKEGVDKAKELLSKGDSLLKNGK